MKRFIFSSAIVLALAAGGGTAYKAAADTAVPAPAAGMPGQPPGQTPRPTFGSTQGPPSGPWACGEKIGAGFRPGPGGGAGFGPPGFGPGGWGRHHDDKFSLFATAKDSALSVADVKVIATAILLEHGNHDWTVSNVSAQGDKSIDFSYATAHGDVVATFAIDPVSGNVTRVN